MTMIYSEALECPVCNSRISVNFVATASYYGQDTDLRRHALNDDPLQENITTCPICYYSDYGHYFKEPRDLNEEVKQRIRENLPPILEKRINASTGYDYAARIGLWRQAPAKEIANLYLCAAWCCADESDTEREKSYRKTAAENFENAINQNEVEAAEIPAITYLIGELYRRAGSIELAHQWFNRAINIEVGDQLKWVHELAKQQRDTPKERI